jgi:hypothetical protein
MTRLFTEGFEDGYLEGSWLLGGDLSGIGRSGALSLNLYNSPGGIHVPIPTTPSPRTNLFIRGAVYPDGDLWNGRYVRFFSGTDTPVELQYYAGSPVWVLVNGQVVITSDMILGGGRWSLIEVHYVLASSGGIVELRIEGSSQGSWTGNTAPLGVGTAITAVRWGGWTAGGSGRQYLDDVAINDTLGSDDYSWCGDGRIVALKPNAVGASSQWVRDGTTINTNNYEQVREVVADLATTYVRSNTAFQKDWYNTQDLNLMPEDTIKRIWASAVAREETADADKFAVGILSGGTEDWSGGLTMTTSWQRFKGPERLTKPAGGAWSQADVNAAQVGIQVV